MTSKTIRQLPAATDLTGSELVYGVQNGTAVKIAVSKVVKVSTDSAAAAAASATAAAGSASAAAASAAAAAGSAASATTSESNAQASKNAAATSETNALSSKNAAATSATNAANSATDALNSKNAAAISETNSSNLSKQAQSYSLTATAQAALAAGYASSVSSISAQDLSGMVAGILHRSPNAISSMFVYDTSKDSDGGAWIDRMQDRSWMNETLVSGNWLVTGGVGGVQSELGARAVGSTLGAELNPASAGDFATGWTPTANSSISGGKVTINTTITSGYAAQTSVSAVVNTPYLVTMTVDVIPAGSGGVSVQLGAINSVSITQVGTMVDVIVPVNAGVLQVVARGANAAAGTVISKVSAKPITAFKTKAGDYYQLATDGRFYKLNRNIVNWSEDFSNGAWSKTNLTITTNASLAPDGNTTMGKLIANTGSSQKYINRVLFGIPLSSSAYTAIIHLKSAEYTKAFVYVDDGTGLSAAWSINLSTGVATQTRTPSVIWTNLSITVTAVANGSWKVVISGNSSATNNQLGFRFGPDPGTTYDAFGHPNAFTGDGVGGIYAWGAAINYGVDSTYEYKAADGAVTEVFRGNTAKFPRLSAIVVENNGATIYALDQPNRPMWMSFKRAGANCLFNNASAENYSLAARDGQLLIGGSNGGGLWQINFASDRAWRHHPSVTSFTGAFLFGLNKRTDTGSSNGYDAGTRYSFSGGGNVNSVALSTRPGAQIDPITGLPIPVIGVAVGSGSAGTLGSVVMEDGSVVTYSQPSNDGISVAFTNKGEVIWGLSTSTGTPVVPLQTSNVANVNTLAGNRNYANGSVPSTGAGTAKRTIQAGQVLATRATVATAADASKLFLIKENPGSPTAGLEATISNSYNTGWMTGDIRRTLMSDVDAGVLSGANLLTGDTVNFTGGTVGNWTAPYQASIAVVGGQLIITATGANPYLALPLTGLPAYTRFRFTYDYVARSNAANGASVFIGSVIGTLAGTDLLPGGVAQGSPSTGKTIEFVTNANGNAYIQFSHAATSGDTFTYDNFSLTTLVSDRSVKVKASTVNGSLSKTAVASAAQLVSYSGFSNDPIVEMASANYTRGIGSDATISTQTDSSFTIVAGASATIAYLNLTTVVGREYSVTANMSTAPATGIVTLAAKPVAAGGGTALASVTLPLNSPQTIKFTATGTSSSITFTGSVNGGTGFAVNGISVKATTAVASAANVVQEAYSADLDFGTAAFSMSAWTAVNNGAFGQANFVPRSDPSSAVPGTPGTMPLNGWQISAVPAGITTQVVAVGTEAGLPYMDVRFSGTPSATQTGFVNMLSANGASGCAAANSQQWTGSAYCKLSAGTLTNFSLQFVMSGRDSSGGPVTGQQINLPFTPTTASLDSQRATSNITFNSASVAFNLIFWQLSFTSGSAVDVTLRLACPQLQRGAVATPPIITTGTAYNGIASIVDRSAVSGPYFRMGVDGNGYFAAEAYDGTTTRRVTSAIAYNNGVRVKLRTNYNGAGTLALNVNGIQVAQTTGAALLTLNNSNALLTIGNARTLDAAYPGNIALVKIGATVPTTEQALFMYGQEVQMFQDGAQVTVPLTTTTLSEHSYDPKLDRVLACGNYDEFSFSGLVRVSYYAGSQTATKSAAGAGCRLVARSGNAEITCPAINLKEELTKSADASLSTFRDIRVFEFDSIASQTDFLLPVGWTAVEVLSGGTLKREGSTKDWIRVFDGFKETIRFSVAPATGTWILITARRG